MTPKTKAPPPDTRKVRQKDPGAFDPRYKDAFLQGLKEPFSLDFPDARSAIKFRQRMQAYRFAVKREGSDKGLIALLYRVKTTLEGSRLTVMPVDFEFDTILSQIKSHEVFPTHTPDPTPRPEGLESPHPAPTIEDLLSDLDSVPSTDPFGEDR